MKMWQTKNGIHIYQVLKGRSNSYLIPIEMGNILVDTGKSSAYKRLRQNIDSVNLKSSKIDMLILTHTHYDHCQNAFAISGQDRCKIAMSEKEAEFAAQGFTTLPKGTFGITRIISGLGSLIGQRRFGYHPFSPDILISKDSELINYGVGISLILTEGHSRGSVSVIVDNEIALVGDAMIGTYKNTIFPPFADDIQKMIKSWGRLLETECVTFLPGHGKEIKRKLLQQEYNKYSLKLNPK